MYFDIIVTDFLEIVAALSGSYYLSKINNQAIRIFVYYLWLTVCVELLSLYAFLFLNNYDLNWFIDLKNSVFCSNTWLQNIYSFLAIGLLGLFYSNLMSSRVFKTIIRVVFLAYSGFAFAFFIVTDAFFVKSLPYNFILGTLAICIYVILYFVELLRNDQLLTYYKLPAFYISIALLLWYLCVTPLFIFDSFFYAMNTNFVSFRRSLLLTINICTYSCFTFGFLYPLSKRG